MSSHGSQIHLACILLHRVLISYLVMRRLAHIPILLHCFYCKISLLVQVTHSIPDDRLVLGVLIFAELDDARFRQRDVRCDGFSVEAFVDIFYEFLSDDRMV